MAAPKRTQTQRRGSSTRSSNSSSTRAAKSSRTGSDGNSRASNRTTSRSGATGRSRSTTGESRAGRSRTALITTDHDEIRQWAEGRGAHPACVKGTGRRSQDIGMVRLDFPGFSGEQSLQRITWDEFFKAFDKNGLALVYQEKTASGQRSNFNKFIKREKE